jgi:hypothetical protein
LYRKIKKQAFSLVEAVIAMVLFSLVATSLFGLYRYHSALTKKLSAYKEKSELHLRAYARLEYIFSKLIYKTEKCHSFFTPDKKAPFEHHSSQGLIFTFNNATDREEGFSYDVLARLALTQNKELTLFIWPNPTQKLSKPQNVRKEVLLQNVERIQLEFWHPKMNKDSKLPKEEQGRWVQEWKREYKIRPLLTRLTLFFENGATPNQRVFLFLSSPRAFEAYKL